MPSHVSIQPGRLYPQPDYTVQIDQEGKWSVTQVFLCHRNSAVALMPRPGSVHPEVPFVAVSQVTAQVTEGDLAEITCVYTGAEESNDEDEQANAVYTIGLSLSEEPLLTHQRYKDLEEEEIEALQAIASGKDTDSSGAPYKDQVTSELGQEALEKIQRGQVSYYSPKITWRESFVRDNGVKNSDLNKIGEIDDPSGNPPSLAQDRDWLLHGVTQTQEGRSYRIEREWLASDRGGWDPDIYQD